MTKAVGDFLGTTGIADEAIRFNGYPFLDRDDHAYNISGQCSSVRFEPYLFIELSLSVSKVMKTDLHCLPVSGATVRDIGEFKTFRRASCLTIHIAEDALANESVQGFPVISNDEKHLLMGYIGRTELRYVVGK